ncbi:helix-turn-helix domain-containing protein [Natronomonas sp. EA1]|uniref:helix-turn-helix domain-containing protein n=1 Tax=Natronomonas sp. EA1 TaxID=3421655 RepID=UPI003EC0D8F6
MSLIAEYSVGGDRLVLGDALAAHPDIRLELERSVAVEPENPILFIWVEGGDLDAFEDAMAADPTATDIQCLSDIGDARLYRLQVTDEVGVVLYPQWVRLGAERLETRFENGTWNSRTRFPDRETIAAYRDFLTENGVSFHLHRLYDSDDVDAHEDGLTERQRETLKLAYARGFFDIPRSTTTAELADELGVSNQAVSERLRRGYARLVEQVIGVE